MLGVAEPLAAIQDAVNIHGFDEIIISTLPKRVSRWLRLDLPHKAAGLGLPVTVVTAQGTEKLAAHAPYLASGSVSRFLFYMQVLIVIFVAAGIVIALIKIVGAMIASIVVGTDGSETAGKAVREAGELAVQLGAAMEIVSAYEPVGRQRLREEARQVPEDMQWMVSAARGRRRDAARGGRASSRSSASRRSTCTRARAIRPTRSSTSPRSAAPT